MQRNHVYPINHPGYIPGRYYQNSPLMSSSSSTTSILAINSITYKPFSINRNINIDRIAISCAGTVSGGVARIGIYSNNNGLPLNLVVDAGELIAATSGIKEAIISLNLANDWYWFAGATNTPPNLNGYSFFGDNNLMGQNTPASNSVTGALRHTGFTYGSFPGVAPTSNLSLITGSAPLFWYRVA